MTHLELPNGAPCFDWKSLDTNKKVSFFSNLFSDKFDEKVLCQALRWRYACAAWLSGLATQGVYLGQRDNREFGDHMTSNNIWGAQQAISRTCYQYGFT